jgi:hypothetical protein
MKRGIILPLLFFGLLSNSLVGAQSVSFTSSPKISILEPKNGATYPDDTITVSFSVTSPAAQKDSTPYPADSVLITCTTGSQEVFSYRLTFENVPPEIQKSFTLTNLGNGRSHPQSHRLLLSTLYCSPVNTKRSSLQNSHRWRSRIFHSHLHSWNGHYSTQTLHPSTDSHSKPFSIIFSISDTFSNTRTDSNTGTYSFSDAWSSPKTRLYSISNFSCHICDSGCSCNNASLL